MEPNGPLRTVHVDLGGSVLLLSCRSAERPALNSRVPVWSDPEKIHIFHGPSGLRAGMASALGLKAAALSAAV
ncbi:hypothetical protein D3C86_2240320 [compost metagenome]